MAVFLARASSPDQSVLPVQEFQHIAFSVDGVFTLSSNYTQEEAQQIVRMLLDTMFAHCRQTIAFEIEIQPLPSNNIVLDCNDEEEPIDREIDHS